MTIWYPTFVVSHAFICLHSILFYSIPVYGIVLYCILFYNNVSCIMHLFGKQTHLFYSILFYSILLYITLLYSILFCFILSYYLFCSVLFYSIIFYFLFCSILFYSLFCSVLFYVFSHLVFTSPGVHRSFGSLVSQLLCVRCPIMSLIRLRIMWGLSGVIIGLFSWSVFPGSGRQYLDGYSLESRICSARLRQ